MDLTTIEKQAGLDAKGFDLFGIVKFAHPEVEAHLG